MIRTKNNIFDYKYTSPDNGTFFGDYKNGTVQKTSLLGAIKEELEKNNSGKAENVYSETPKSNFININNTNSNSIIKGTDTTPVLPKITENKTTTQKQGGLIKNNITHVLSHIYGEPDTKHLFDDIDDEDVEKNIPIAESAIQTNIDRGNLSKDALAKLPNLRDGMTLFYAASDKGNNRAATKAREAAYTEWASPTLKEVERSLKATEKTNSDVKSDQDKNDKEKSSLALNSYSGKNNIGSVNLKNNLNYPVTKNLMPGVDDLDRLILPADSEVSLEKIKNDFDYSEGESSKLNPYDIYDIIRDWKTPSNDESDIYENFQNEDFISGMIDYYRNDKFRGKPLEIAKDMSRIVWKAGSELYLKPKGYTVSAEMLEHSLQENPEDVVFYDDSEIAKKIKNDKGFVDHLDEVAYKVENNIPLSKEDKWHNFEAYNDQDLYYSLHGCQIAIDNISYNDDGTKDISVHLWDNYDYTEIWTAMDGEKFSPFKVSLGSVANDLGTITTKFDAMNPYKVDIYFTIRR